MNILIAGSSGLLGKDLFNIFKINNINVKGTYNKNKINSDLDYIDFFDINIIETYCIINKITHIINLIAERNPEKCENNWDLTYKINIKLVDNLLYVCNKINITLIHLSTDYVFDGINPPYNITSEKNPLQNYGKSKNISEEKIINNNRKFIIIRTNVLYSLSSNLSESPVTIIGKYIMNLSNKYTLDDYYIRRPVNCLDLSKFILNLCINNRQGVYHFYNPDINCTKYKIGLVICNILNINNIKKQEIIDYSVIRPYDTQLISTEVPIHKSIFSEDLKTIFSKYTIPNINSINKEKIIFLLDLDGTIVSEDIHFEVYRIILTRYGIDFTKEQYIESTNNQIYDGRCTNYLLKNNYINEIQAEEISNLKKELILTYDYPTTLIPNFDIFLNKILKITDKIAVVSNSPKKYIDLIKEKHTLLNNIKYWVTRDDYKKPKPDCEPYMTALKKFNIDISNINEYTILGFENSYLGLKSINQVTNLVFDCSYDYTMFNKYDGVYYFNDYNQIISLLDL